MLLDFNLGRWFRMAVTGFYGCDGDRIGVQHALDEHFEKRIFKQAYVGCLKWTVQPDPVAFWCLSREIPLLCWNPALCRLLCRLIDWAHVNSLQARVV